MPVTLTQTFFGPFHKPFEEMAFNAGNQDDLDNTRLLEEERNGDTTSSTGSDSDHETLTQEPHLAATTNRHVIDQAMYLTRWLDDEFGIGVNGNNVTGEHTINRQENARPSLNQAHAIITNEFQLTPMTLGAKVYSSQDPAVRTLLQNPEQARNFLQKLAKNENVHYCTQFTERPEQENNVPSLERYLLSHLLGGADPIADIVPNTRPDSLNPNRQRLATIDTQEQLNWHSGTIESGAAAIDPEKVINANQLPTTPTTVIDTDNQEELRPNEELMTLFSDYLTQARLDTVIDSHHLRPLFTGVTLPSIFHVLNPSWLYKEKARIAYSQRVIALCGNFLAAKDHWTQAIRENKTTLLNAVAELFLAYENILLNNTFIQDIFSDNGITETTLNQAYQAINGRLADQETEVATQITELTEEARTLFQHYVNSFSSLVTSPIAHRKHQLRAGEQYEALAALQTQWDDALTDLTQLEAFIQNAEALLTTDHPDQFQTKMRQRIDGLRSIQAALTALIDTIHDLTLTPTERLAYFAPLATLEQTLLDRTQTNKLALAQFNQALHAYTQKRHLTEQSALQHAKTITQQCLKNNDTRSLESLVTQVRGFISQADLLQLIPTIYNNQSISRDLSQETRIALTQFITKLYIACIPEIDSVSSAMMHIRTAAHCFQGPLNNDEQSVHVKDIVRYCQQRLKNVKHTLNEHEMQLVSDTITVYFSNQVEAPEALLAATETQTSLEQTILHWFRVVRHLSQQVFEPALTQTQPTQSLTPQRTSLFNADNNTANDAVDNNDALKTRAKTLTEFLLQQKLLNQSAYDKFIALFDLAEPNSSASAIIMQLAATCKTSLKCFIRAPKAYRPLLLDVIAVLSRIDTPNSNADETLFFKGLDTYLKLNHSAPIFPTDITASISQIATELPISHKFSLQLFSIAINYRSSDLLNIFIATLTSANAFDLDGQSTLAFFESLYFQNDQDTPLAPRADSVRIPTKITKQLQNGQNDSHMTSGSDVPTGDHSLTEHDYSLHQRPLSDSSYADIQASHINAIRLQLEALLSEEAEISQLIDALQQANLKNFAAAVIDHIGGAPSFVNAQQWMQVFIEPYERLAMQRSELRTIEQVLTPLREALWQRLLNDANATPDTSEQNQLSDDITWANALINSYATGQYPRSLRYTLLSHINELKPGPMHFIFRPEGQQISAQTLGRNAALIDQLTEASDYAKINEASEFPGLDYSQHQKQRFFPTNLTKEDFVLILQQHLPFIDELDSPVAIFVKSHWGSFIRPDATPFITFIKKMHEENPEDPRFQGKHLAEFLVEECQLLPETLTVTSENRETLTTCLTELLDEKLHYWGHPLFDDWIKHLKNVIENVCDPSSQIIAALQPMADTIGVQLTEVDPAENAILEALKQVSEYTKGTIPSAQLPGNKVTLAQQLIDDEQLMPATPWKSSRLKAQVDAELTQFIADRLHYFFGDLRETLIEHIGNKMVFFSQQSSKNTNVGAHFNDMLDDVIRKYLEEESHLCLFSPQPHQLISNPWSPEEEYRSTLINAFLDCFRNHLHLLFLPSFADKINELNRRLAVPFTQPPADLEAHKARIQEKYTHYLKQAFAERSEKGALSACQLAVDELEVRRLANAYIEHHQLLPEECSPDARTALMRFVSAHWHYCFGDLGTYFAKSIRHTLSENATTDDDTVTAALNDSLLTLTHELIETFGLVTGSDHCTWEDQESYLSASKNAVAGVLKDHLHLLFLDNVGIDNWLRDANNLFDKRQPKNSAELFANDKFKQPLAEQVSQYLTTGKEQGHQLATRDITSQNQDLLNATYTYRALRVAHGDSPSSITLLVDYQGIDNGMYLLAPTSQGPLSLPNATSEQASATPYTKMADSWLAKANALGTLNEPNDWLTKLAKAYATYQQDPEGKIATLITQAIGAHANNPTLEITPALAEFASWARERLQGTLRELSMPLCFGPAANRAKKNGLALYTGKPYTKYPSRVLMWDIQLRKKDQWTPEAISDLILGVPGKTLFSQIGSCTKGNAQLPMPELPFTSERAASYNGTLILNLWSTPVRQTSHLHAQYSIRFMNGEVHIDPIYMESSYTDKCRHSPLREECTMIALTQIRHDTPYIDTQNLTKAVEECHSPFEQIRLAQTLQTMYDSDDNNGSCSPLGFKCSQIIEEKLKAETFNNGTLNDPRQREPNPQFEKKYLPHITQPVNATLEAAMLTLARTQETPAFYPKQAGYTLYRLSLEHTTKEIANGILNTWLGTTEVNLATLTINGLSHLQFLLGDQQLTPLQQYCALSLIIEPTDRFDLKESLQNMGQALGIKTNASHNEALFLAILSMEKRGLNKDDLLELINEADYPQRALAVQKAWRDQASDLSNSPARKKSKIQQADSLLASLCSHATFEFLPTLRGDQTRIETLISKEHTPYDQLIQVAKWLPSDQHWDSGYEDYLINRFGFEDRTTIRAQLGGLISTRDFYTLCLALANHHPHWQEKIAALFEAPMGSPAYLKVLLAIYKDLDASNMEGLQGILLYQLKTYYQLAVTTTAEAKDIHAQPLTKREDIVCLNIYLKAKLLPCYQGDAVQTLYEQLVKTWGQHASELSEHQATWQRFQANRYQRTSHAHLLDSCALHFASLNRFRSSPLKAQLFLNLFLNYLKQQFGLKKLSSDVLTSINAVFTTIGQTDVASNVLTLLQAGIPVSDAGNAIHLKSPEQLDLSEVRRLNPDYCQALASHYVRFGEKRSRCLALYSTVLKSGNVTKEIAAEYSKQLGLRETCDDTLNSRQMAQLAILYDDYFTAMQNEGTPEEFKALRVTYCRIIANKETLANGQNLYGNGLNDSRHSVSFSDLPNGKL